MSAKNLAFPPPFRRPRRRPSLTPFGASIKLALTPVGASTVLALTPEGASRQLARYLRRQAQSTCVCACTPPLMTVALSDPSDTGRTRRRSPVMSEGARSGKPSQDPDHRYH